MVLLRHGGVMKCQVLNLSLEGCLIRSLERFGAGIQMRVEVSFKVNGIAFRFNGVTRWTDGQNLAGIEFVDVIPRRREALADVLDEVEAARAAKAGKGTAEQPEAEHAPKKLTARASAELKAQERLERAAEEKRALEWRAMAAAEKAAEAARGAGARLAREEAERQAEQSAQRPHADGENTSNQKDAAAQGEQPGKLPDARPAPRERRTQQRHQVDTKAAIHMVRAGLQLHGRIQNLSAGGCLIRTDEPFPVGIYTRVETEFRVEGLPFRLGGVIQSIHDRARFLVGIRFLDMSERKRGQLTMLIEEIEALEAMKDGAGGSQAGAAGH